MPRTLFDATSRQQLLDRLAGLRPDSPRQFGRMTPHEMMCHMEDALRVATGEVPARARRSFLANPIVRRLIIYYVPWPKAKAQTVPEMQVTRPVEFDADRARLRAMMETAAAQGPAGSWAVHPAFGKLSGKDYGVLIYRHFDHHFRQFGI